MKDLIDNTKLENIDRKFNELMKTKDIMKDGILCIERYNKVAPRIVWVLKQDINYGQSDYALHLSENMHRITDSPTWRRLAYVSHGIISGERSFDEIYEIGPEKCGESLRATAIIEANKELGEERSADDVILTGFEQYKDLIFEQITAYKPDVVIVAMVGRNECLKPIVEEIFKHYTNKPVYFIDDHAKSNGADVALSHVDDKVFLWAYHPSYLNDISDQDYFDTFVKAYDSASQPQ